MATVWNQADKTAHIVLSTGCHTATSYSNAVSAASNEAVRGTTSHGASGKYYLEFTGVTHFNTVAEWGFADASVTLGAASGQIRVATTGNFYTNTTLVSIGGDPAGHTICYALDFDNKKAWARYDGGNWNGSGTANPATNTGGLDITGFTSPVFPHTLHQFAGGTATLNCGDSTFVQTMPSGFTAWDTSVRPATPEVTHVANNTFSSTNTGTVAYTTVGADNIIVLHITSEPNHTTGSVAVSTVTDTNGLTWTLKTSLHFLSASSPNTDNTQEVWWAHATSAISGTITVTMGATIDDAALTTVSVSGVGSVTAPWDTNSSLPATATNTTGASVVPSVPISTTAASTKVLGFYGSPHNIVETGGSLTIFDAAINAGGANYARNFVGEADYTTAQSSITASLGPASDRFGFIVLALAGSGGGGSWASTEATDVFSAGGYSGSPGVWGYLASTEAKDVFAGIGYPADFGTWTSTEPPDAFHAYGYLPVKGTMAITEHPDIFHAVAIGAGGVNGAWASTEARDIFAAVGSAPIYGILAATEAADHFQAFSSGVTQVRRRREFFVT